MKLWLVRHAQPLVAPGMCYGALDMAADRIATAHAAQALAAELPPGLCVVSSPLQRCEQLSLFLRGLRPDLIYHTDTRLTEMDFGCWEGQRWDVIDPAQLQAWTDHFSNWQCGGGESVAMFMERVASAWDVWTSLHADLVWITHAGVIRAAGLLASGQRHLCRAEDWPVDAPGYGQWCVLDIPSSVGG